MVKENDRGREKVIGRVQNVATAIMPGEQSANVAKLLILLEMEKNEVILDHVHHASRAMEMMLTVKVRKIIHLKIWFLIT